MHQPNPIQLAVMAAVLALSVAAAIWSTPEPALPINPQDQGPMLTPPPPGWNERSK